MAETNGVTPKPDLYRAPDSDLEGWYVVDSIDGRRWLGKIVASHHTGAAAHHYLRNAELPLLPDELVLQPSFEFYPDKLISAQPVPEANPLNPQQMRITTQVFKQGHIDFTALLDLAKNGLPPQRVRYAGIGACADWAPDRRKEMAKALRKTIEAARPDLPEAVRPVDGPREKVR